jgi:hypothetical protein
LIRGGALALAFVILLLAAGPAGAQERRGPQRLQDSAQPNPQEVRPASPDGDSPSATAGEVEGPRPSPRVLGLPVEAVMWIGGAMVVLVLIAALIAGRPRRRAQAQGGGTYGRGPGN